MADGKKHFDLAAALRDVSDLDTGNHVGREQIEYIDIGLIDTDPTNFYSMSGIDELAANIECIGLQQPLRVRPNPTDPARWMIVSGHRRRAAMQMLVDAGREDLRKVPCIRDRSEGSAALTELRLIFANSDTRSMSSADISRQAERVEALLYQLKEEGYDFPGRMRDHVAQACNVSKTKLARLRVIRENLADCWMTAWKNDVVKEAVAYELSHLPRTDQQILMDVKQDAQANIRFVSADTVKKFTARCAKIDRLKCPQNGEPCQNRVAKKIKAASTEYYCDCPCTKCCAECDKLPSCKQACPQLASQKAQMRQERRAVRQKEQAEKEERERPTIDYIQGVYSRVGQARKAAGLTVRDLYDAQKIYYGSADETKQETLERGIAKITEYTNLPFGYSFCVGNARNLCAVADALHCSIDYLLGRAENVSKSDTWRTGKPEQLGVYNCLFRWFDGAAVSTALLSWDGDCWVMDGVPLDEVEATVLYWIPMPDTDNASGLDTGKAASPLNNACITGLSSSGHCGAAACCSQPYDCCLQCPEPCNSQCGWCDGEIAHTDGREG